MAVREIGVIVNGATGRIGSTQHLANALAPIRAEGGLAVGGDRIMPRLLLIGRDQDRLSGIAKAFGIDEIGTDLDAALAKPDFEVFFDAAATSQRVAALTKAIAAGKHVYTEKPVAPTVAQGLELLRAAQARGLKTGASRIRSICPGCASWRSSPPPVFSVASPASGSNSVGGCSTASSGPASVRAGITGGAAAEA